MMKAETIVRTPAPTGDEPVDNLRRIRRDAAIRRTVESDVDRILAVAEGPVAVAFADMDSSAELRGESLTVKLAAVEAMRQRCSEVLPAGGTVHPLGTRDELVMTVPLAEDDPEAEAMASLDAIREAVAAAALDVAGRTIPVTLSAGVSVWPLDAHTAYDLLLLADGGCRQAKSLGRNRCGRAEAGFRHVLSTSVSDLRRRQLAVLSARTGRPVDDLLRRAVDLVLERHSGLERFAAGAEQLP
jgi:GGDEF domain-containing protein